MKAKEVKKILGVTQRTLNNYIKTKKLSIVKINKYHYEYNDNDVYKMIGLNNPKNIKFNVIYSRVSLPKQKNDLLSQSKRLNDFCISRGIIVKEQLEDIKSGMNFNDRKSFNKLIEYVIKGNIDKIIIENKDRLCRFGFDLFMNFCKYYGTEILITSETINKSYEQELTDDLISIIHYFSMKSYSHRRTLNKIKNEIKTLKINNNED